MLAFSWVGGSAFSPSQKWPILAFIFTASRMFLPFSSALLILWWNSLNWSTWSDFSIDSDFSRRLVMRPAMVTSRLNNSLPQQYLAEESNDWEWHLSGVKLWFSTLSGPMYVKRKEKKRKKRSGLKIQETSVCRNFALVWHLQSFKYCQFTEWIPIHSLVIFTPLWKRIQWRTTLHTD